MCTILDIYVLCLSHKIVYPILMLKSSLDGFTITRVTHTGIIVYLQSNVSLIHALSLHLQQQELPFQSTQVHVHSFVFSVLYCKSLFVPRLLAVVLSVLQFTDFEDLFGIFKLVSQ